MPNSKEFTQIIKAFTLAAPFALATQSSSLAQCVEASVVGQKVLRSFGVSTTLTPCGLLARPLLGGKLVSLGMTPADVYHRTEGKEKHPEPFAQWWEANRGDAIFTAHEYPMHMVLRAENGPRRVLIDATLGQLKQNCGVEVPFADYFVLPEKRIWPRFSTVQGWNIEYFSSPHQDKTSAHAANVSLPPDWEFILKILMDLALKVGGDRKAFVSNLEFIMPPALVARAMAVLFTSN